MNPSLLVTGCASLLLAGLLPAQQGQGEASEAERIAELERQVAAFDRELESLQFGGDSPLRPIPEGGLAGLAPAASKVYETEQGLAIGGYGEMLYTDRFGSDGDQLDIYRAIVYLGYRFDENWLFNSEIEWEHGNETALEFAYLEYQSGSCWNVRVGHQLVPMGFINQIHEPTTFWSPNRPLVERYILPTTWHENGASVYGTFSEDFDYHVALMNGFDAAGFELESSGLRGGRQGGSKAAADDLAAIARLDWRGVEGLWLGGSAYVGDSGQDSAASDFATTVWEVHAQWQDGPFQARAVYAAAGIDDAALLPNATAATGEDLVGYYVDLGYDVFAPNEGGAALIPFVRYAAYDLAEDTAADSEVTRIMAGLAWQPIPQLIFKGALTREEQGPREDDILELAAGYVF